jgi:DNA polymerase-3 subunit alpha
MGKKKEEVMRQERDYFVNGLKGDGKAADVPGCRARGIKAEVANEIFDQMVSFASYAFNKSHAAAYSVVSYQTAWLKAYYPKEFMAAILSSFMAGDSTQVARKIRNCVEMGIEVLPPDILKSDLKFTVQDGSIRFGLLGVKGVGAGAIEAIVEAREEAVAKGRPIDGLHSFLRAVDLDRVNKKAVESLINAGAFDGFEPNRAKYMAVFEILMDSIRKSGKSQIDGQISLSDLLQDEGESTEIDIPIPDVQDFPKHERLNREKEVLGIYLSGHPLDEYRDVVEFIAKEEMNFITTERFVVQEEETGGEDEQGMQSEHDKEDELQDNMPVCFVGVVTAKRTQFTKKGDLYAIVTLEDLYGSADVFVWPEPYERCAESTEPDCIVVVRGRLSMREGEAPKIMASKVTPIDVAASYFERKYGKMSS